MSIAVRPAQVLYLVFSAAVSALDSAPTFKQGDLLFITQEGSTNKLYRYRDSDTVFVTEFPSIYKPLYSVDEANALLYLHEENALKYYILELNDNTPAPKPFDELPEGYYISSVSRIGDNLVLYKAVWGDEYYYSNYPCRPGRTDRVPPYMLFKFNRTSKEVVRLTLTNSQKESLITPDGKYVLYRSVVRLGQSFNYYNLVFGAMDGDYQTEISEYPEPTNQVESVDITASPLDVGCYIVGGLMPDTASEYEYFIFLPGRSYSQNDKRELNAFRFLVVRSEGRVFSHFINEFPFQWYSPRYVMNAIYYFGFDNNICVFSAVENASKETAKLYSCFRPDNKKQPTLIPYSEGVIYGYYFKGDHSVFPDLIRETSIHW